LSSLTARLVLNNRRCCASPSPGGGGSNAERSEGSRGGVSFPYLNKRSPHPARFARDPPPPGEGEESKWRGNAHSQSARISDSHFKQPAKIRKTKTAKAPPPLFSQGAGSAGISIPSLTRGMLPH